MKFSNDLYVVVVIYLGASLDITKAYSRSRSSSSGRDCIKYGGKIKYPALHSDLDGPIVSEKLPLCEKGF